MKRAPTVKQWAALVCGAALLAAVLVLRARGDLARLGRDAELVRLREERQRLAACDDAAVQAARAAVEILRQSRIEVDWSASWTDESVPAASDQASRQRLRQTSPVSWADLVQSIENELARTGTRVVSMDITSRGSRQVRAIAAVEIVLEHPAETPSRQNPSGGTVFPRADVPATPPAVGAGRRSAVRPPPPSLRLPASRSLLSGPTPGPRAGFPSTHQPQSKHP